MVFVLLISPPCPWLASHTPERLCQERWLPVTGIGSLLGHRLIAPPMTEQDSRGRLMEHKINYVSWSLCAQVKPCYDTAQAQPGNEVFLDISSTGLQAGK